MRLSFTKMHGLGNDFVVFNAISQQVELGDDQLRFIADRHFGVGCDQILLVENPRDSATDFYYRIFNADGSEVEQCGNGARCFARFVLDKGLAQKDQIDVGTLSGNIRLIVEKNGFVRVNMGEPVFEPARIPFLAEERTDPYELQVARENLKVGVVSMGNPHAVLTVESVATAPVERLGPLIQANTRFPRGANIEFMEIRDPRHVRLRVFERGAGETLACGTGACAAVVIGRMRGQLADEVSVSLPGGDLVVHWDGKDQPVWMSGPAASVYEGEIDL